MILTWRCYFFLNSNIPWPQSSVGWKIPGCYQLSFHSTFHLLVFSMACIRQLASKSSNQVHCHSFSPQKCIDSGRICNNFEKNRAFYDKSMKLGTWLVDNNTNKLRVSATPKMSSNGRHLVFSKMAAFLNFFIIMSF